MLNKKDQRVRRAQQTRRRIAIQRTARLTVHRTNLHIYASLISDDGARVLASASTLEADVRKGLAGESKVAGKGSNVAAAAVVGKRIAEKAKAAGIEQGGVRPRRVRIPRPRQGARRSRARSRPPVLIGRHRWQSSTPAPRPKATTTA